MNARPKQCRLRTIRKKLRRCVGRNLLLDQRCFQTTAGDAFCHCVLHLIKRLEDRQVQNVSNGFSFWICFDLSRSRLRLLKRRRGLKRLRPKLWREGMLQSWMPCRPVAHPFRILSCFFLACTACTLTSTILTLYL